jgi:hypothetical protein
VGENRWAWLKGTRKKETTKICSENK